MKEAPQTTVAEDLAQPSREQMMRAMAQMQGQAQPMSQPPQSLNAGLMSAAQPEELAAMDANAAPQQAMAGGGLVAFSKGGEADDGVAHYFGGGATDADDMSTPVNPMSYGEQMSNVFGAIANAPMQLIRRIVSDPSLDEDQKKAAIAKVKDQTDAESSRLVRQNAAPVSTFTAPTSGRSKGDKADKGEKSTGGRNKERLNMPPAQAALAPEQVQLNELTKGILAFKDLNPEEQAAAQARGEAAYEKKTPFRLGFLEESMKERQGELDRMKDTAFNNMLMQTGAGIMKSKSPYFLSALGEGSEAGLAAYQQGVKDMRASKDALLQSKVAFANAQTLYDQGKTSAGERERDRADKLNSRGLELANSKFAVYKNIQDNKREDEKMAMERELLPVKKQLYGAQANYYNQAGSAKGAAGNKLSDADQKAAEEYANSTALMQGNKLGTPEFEKARNRIYQEEILRRAAGVSYQPGASPAAGTGGVEFLGFK
jgi:hypothetical protein